ncbi:MAG: radical SAM protein [Deltaproteobacteria bacterium]|nr:radical SAM protein [Deltaproteobacteria bacterium]
MARATLKSMFLRKARNFREALRLRKNIRRLMRPDDLIAPSHLAIETTNFCPAKCVFCPSQTQTRPRGVMDMELFRRIIFDAKDCGSVTFITHGGLGEPLMDKSISEKVALEKSLLTARTQIHTNGALLDEATTRKLYDAELDVLSISLNAFHSRTHRHVTGLDYETVRANTERAFDIKDKTGAKVDLRITMVRTANITPTEEKDFVRYWEKFTPKIAVHPEKNWGGWRKNTVTHAKYPCKWIWYMISVNWDGAVTLCHEDYDAKHVIGDLKDSGILKVFNCEEIRRLRATFAKGKFPEREPCEDCSRLRLDKAFWLEANVRKLPSGAISYAYREHR